MIHSAFVLRWLWSRKKHSCPHLDGLIEDTFASSNYSSDYWLQRRDIIPIFYLIDSFRWIFVFNQLTLFFTLVVSRKSINWQKDDRKRENGEEGKKYIYGQPIGSSPLQLHSRISLFFFFFFLSPTSFFFFPLLPSSASLINITLTHQVLRADTHTHSHTTRVETP